MGKRSETDIEKHSVLEAIDARRGSQFNQYCDFYVGERGLAAFLKFELAAVMLVPMPGAVGLLLRKKFYPNMVRAVGSNVVWGRNITLRHPGRISLGSRVAIDDNCMLDARGDAVYGITIGDDVLIARSTIIQAKEGPLAIGNRVTIGSQSQVASIGGIVLADDVMVGGHCYIGGGHYHFDDRNKTIAEQGLYSKGPIRIDKDVYIGVGVRVLDGVHIAEGAVIGAGAVIQEDVPAYTIVSPFQKVVKMPRGT